MRSEGYCTCFVCLCVRYSNPSSLRPKSSTYRFIIGFCWISTREFSKLITMFNIINGNIVFPAGIFNLHQHLSQRNNSSVFHRLHSRTNYFYFSYVPSVITVWNTLPVDIRSSSSVSVFKHNLLHWAHVLY